MNETIQTLLKNFVVNGEKIASAFLNYEGHDEPYIVWMHQDASSSCSGDDDLIGYIDYYDFDVYSKGNYTDIITALIRLLESNNFKWQPSRSSQDMYDVDTGYYHRTLNFAIHYTK